jgi:transposase InsO family protein
MMLDADVVAVSPATTYRVLRAAGRLNRWNKKPSKKGTGFVQPLAPHEHWHVDISYLNVAGTFYYLCSLLDGASRAIVHWEIREQMTELDVECVMQRARERFPGAKPRIISDPTLKRIGPCEAPAACVFDQLRGVNLENA